MHVAADVEIAAIPALILNSACKIQVHVRVQETARKSFSLLDAFWKMCTFFCGKHH